MPSSEPTVNVEVVLLPVAGTERIWLALKATFAVFAETSNVAPDAIDIVTEFAIVPDPLKASVPDEIEVLPVNVFTPVNVQVPASCFVRVPVVVPTILAKVPP